MTESGAGPAGGDGSEPSDGGLPWELLDGYFAGSATRGERAQVITWIGGARVRREEIEAIRRLWLHGAMHGSSGPRWDTARAVASLEHQLGRTRPTSHDPSLTHVAADTPGSRFDLISRSRRWLPTDPWRWRPLLSLAAAAVLGVALGTAWRVGGSREDSEPVEQFSTGANQRVRVTLRDGTTLTLGPSTRLRIPSHFGATRRVLDLDGEALFTVVHDPAHPFEIHTARAVVHDVGTTFDVLAYAGDSIERVLVVEGSVSIGGKSLARRDVGVIDGDGRLTLTHNADVQRLLVWSEGGLAFSDTPIRDVLRALQRNYELRVTLHDPALAAQRVTASFVAGTPADIVLHDLTAIIGATYRRSGQSVVIQR